MLSPGKGEGDKKRLQLDLIRKGGGGKGGGVAAGKEKIPPHFQVVERGEEEKGFLFQLWGEGREEKRRAPFSTCKVLKENRPISPRGLSLMQHMKLAETSQGRKLLKKIKGTIFKRGLCNTPSLPAKKETHESYE